VAVIGASTGLFGAVWAQAEVRKVLKTIGARVVESELPVSKAPGAFAADETLMDGDLHRQLQEVVDALVEQVEIRERLAA
jgi:chromate reductase